MHPGKWSQNFHWSVLVVPPGALRLLRAYGKIDDGVVRRTIVAMIETVVNRPVGKSRKR
jgi:hypothetical protein